MSMNESGLRELKKRMTRETIAAASLRLADEKGVSRVTIEEIAQRAVVSPRTVSNYFAAKEQAIVVAGTPDWGVVVERFLGSAPSEEPLSTIRDLVLEAVGEMSEEDLALDRRVLGLAAEHPALRPFLTAEYDAVGERLSAAIAAQAGTDPDTDLYPRLVSAVAVAALLVAQRAWAAGEATGAERLTTLIRDAFDRCAAGLGVAQPA